MTVTPSPTGNSFGFPEQMFTRMWTLREIADVLAVSPNTARAMLDQPCAPPPLTLGSGRTRRWNPYQVMAWAHSAAEQPTAAETAAGQGGCSATALDPPDVADVVAATPVPAGRRPGARWSSPGGTVPSSLSTAPRGAGVAR